MLPGEPRRDELLLAVEPGGPVGVGNAERFSPKEYTSPLFTGRRRYAERTCDSWFVLSALHGLLRPDQVIEPYDQTLKNASGAERRGWSRQVLADLEAAVGDLRPHTFELHAGQDYIAWGLEEGLRQRGAEVIAPTRGLPLGNQLAFYAGQP